MLDEKSFNILSTTIGEGPYQMLIAISIVAEGEKGRFRTAAIGGGTEITAETFDTYPEAKALYEKCIAIKLAQFQNMTGLTL